MKHEEISFRKHVLFDDLIEHSAFGPRFSGEHYSDSGNIVTLRTTDISESGEISYEHAPRAVLNENQFCNHFLRIGDLVITRSGRVGTAAVFNGHEDPVLPGAFLIRFRLKSHAVPQFYRYYFNSTIGRQNLLSVARGAAQQNINITNVKGLRVLCPPKSEQLEIVRLLSTYDDLIENNKRRIELLEESARQLYKEWFVRFRFPGHEHVKIIDGVPEGWNYRSLIEIAELTMGQSPKSEFYNSDGEGLPFHQGVTNFGFRFVKHETYCTQPTRLSKAGDILFSVRAPVGRINITNDVIVLGRGLAAIRSIDGYQSFFFYALKSYFFKEDMIGGGAIYAAVTKKDMESQELLIPTNNLLQEFEELASDIDKQIYQLDQMNIYLTKARDILLPKLMSGEIAV